jgi:hypothetical protein
MPSGTSPRLRARAPREAADDTEKRRELHAAQQVSRDPSEIPATSAGSGLATGMRVMKRPRLSLASIVPAGRHCHSLGLLIAALLVVTINTLRHLLAPGVTF